MTTTLNAGHLAKGDNLRTVHPDLQPSARAALRLLLQLEYEENYWQRQARIRDDRDDDKPRR